MPRDERDEDTATGYWVVLEPWWERIDIYSGAEAFLASYSAAPLVERDLFAAHFCESEVANGGLHQFFANPTGVLAPEAATAYRHMGLPDLAAILEKAMASFGEDYPRDHEARLAVLPPLEGGEQSSPFGDLDERFYAACGRGAAGRYDGSRLYNALDAHAANA
jgi:hypothetical protein